MTNTDTINRTVSLLEELVASKQNLVDTLVAKCEEAELNEPFADLVEKAANYVPKTYIFVDSTGNQSIGTLVEYETTFDATAEDIREGKVAATDTGVIIGTLSV